MIVINHSIGLRPGGSLYPVQCDKCYKVVDTDQRKHVSPEHGKARAPDGLRPGEEWMVDAGDATVRSKWGSFRYFLLFICAKTSYIAICYLKDNSARSYVAALKYVCRPPRACQKRVWSKKNCMAISSQIISKLTSWALSELTLALSLR